MSTRIQPLHAAFAGFCIAAIGVSIGFLAAGFEIRSLGIAAFVIAVFGVLVGFCGVIYGWKVLGREAIAGSVRAAGEWAGRVKKLFNVRSR